MFIYISFIINYCGKLLHSNSRIFLKEIKKTIDPKLSTVVVHPVFLKPLASGAQN